MALLFITLLSILVAASSQEEPASSRFSTTACRLDDRECLLDRARQNQRSEEEETNNSESKKKSSTCRLDDRDCLLGEEKTSRPKKPKRNKLDDEFWSWNLDEDSLMSALFSDLSRLKAAWEDHPLLSKASFQKFGGRQRLSPMNSIPAVFHNRSSLLKYSGFDANYARGGEDDPITSLFSAANALEVLQHPHMEHMTDYKMVKTMVHDGTSRVTLSMGQERRHHEIKEITDRFHKEGMSLIINNMQSRWSKFGTMARTLEEELGAARVTANLYMTPEALNVDGNQEGECKNSHENCPGWAKDGECKINKWMLTNCCESCSAERSNLANQGKDAHWDSTDVIIVQLAGKKRWSVAREPIVYMSNRDKKRKPTMEEIEHYGQHNRYREFTMCPGDVLYIPRGHIHNASTVPIDSLKRKWGDWDDCIYPDDAPEAEPLARALVDTPSIHITFALATDYTMESLLHLSLYEFFGEGDTERNGVVIPTGTCHNQAQHAMPYDVRWQQVLHHSLAEVARRENDCDNPSHREIPPKPRKECNATLRQMVPFLLLDENVFKTSKTLSVKKQVDVRMLKKSHATAADRFASMANLEKTIDFVRDHVLHTCFDCGTSFLYPYYRPEQEAILCPDDLGISKGIRAELMEAEFRDLVDAFVYYAKEHFFEAFERLNQDCSAARDEDRGRQAEQLQMVGQSD